MPSRPDLHPDLARYLRQQIELGGTELYLENVPRSAFRVPVSEAQGSTAEPAPGVLTAQGQPPEMEEMVPPRRMDFPLPVAERGTRNLEPAPPGTAPKWRKDAPPIPGPGLSIMPPDAGLLGDDVTRLESLDAVAEMIRGCRKCVLCQTRTRTVPGEGNPAARLMCVGEGPGATEDETGRPFVGAAGQLLDQILAAIECPRETVYIANIVKCRPPGNRKPFPDEATSCLPYLHRQIALVRPKVIIALGGTAAEWLLGVKRSLTDLRGQVHRFAGIPLIVTYHPAALLRNPNWKKPTWDDVRIARQLLDV
jgi:DNA polymerase